MYISYFNIGIRKENVNKHSELRIYAPKIASRFFGTVSEFTYEADGDFKNLILSNVYPSKNIEKYNTELREFILRNPYTTKLYAVIRNPKDRLRTAIAQLVYSEEMDIDIDSAAKKLSKEMMTDTHMNRYHEVLYTTIYNSNNGLLKDRLIFKENVVIEDIDETTYYAPSMYEYPSNEKPTNQSLFNKVYKLMEYINKEEQFINVKDFIKNYSETETYYYNKLKTYSKDLDI